MLHPSPIVAAALSQQQPTLLPFRSASHCCQSSLLCDPLVFGINDVQWRSIHFDESNETQLALDSAGRLLVAGRSLNQLNCGSIWAARVLEHESLACRLGADVYMGFVGVRAEEQQRI